MCYLSDLHSQNGGRQGENAYSRLSGGQTNVTNNLRHKSVLEAADGQDSWITQIQFLSHDTLEMFQLDYKDTQTPIDITPIFSLTIPDAGAWYGLTTPQRETIMSAVEQDYYFLPREASTVTVAHEFDISYQAAAERLRCAIDTPVSNRLELTVAGGQ